MLPAAGVSGGSATGRLGLSDAECLVGDGQQFDRSALLVGDLDESLRREDLDDGSVAPVVLPKPAFGWTILDAIRAHAQARTPQGGDA